jgi:hypothetical protein
LHKSIFFIKKLIFLYTIYILIIILLLYTLLKYGGPDGELGASMRYISQRYSMPYREVAGLLTDIGTEELAPRSWI